MTFITKSFGEDLLRLGNAFDFPDCGYRRFLPASYSFLRFNVGVGIASTGSICQSKSMKWIHRGM